MRRRIAGTIVFCLLALGQGVVPGKAQAALATRVVFDDKYLSHPLNYYGYHGFTAYDVNGAPVTGSYDTFTATITGPSGPKTLDGQLDYYGRGVIGYRGASTPGTDVINIVVGAGTGRATRSYGLENLPVAPTTTSGVPARIEFDDNHYSVPTGYYGYHGFTVFDSMNRPVLNSYDSWTATVMGPNGPKTFSGTLDYNGRGVFGYGGGPLPGTDTLVVTAGAGIGHATRSYQGGVGVPDVPPTILPPVGVEPTVQQPTPAANLQTWTINIEHLGKTNNRPIRPHWDGVIRSMALAPFKPDIIMVQEIWANDEMDTFLRRTRDILGETYAFMHGNDYDASGTVNPSGDAIVYNTARLDPRGGRLWNGWALAGEDEDHGNEGTGQDSSGCTQQGKGQFAATLFDRMQGKNVVVASVHTSGACVARNTEAVAWQTDQLAGVRPITIIGGDFNARPDKTGLAGVTETAAQGLETDPDCWYRTFSAGHGEITHAAMAANPTNPTACKSLPTGIYDRYYDTVWLKAGGATNPAASELCEQFTRMEEFDTFPDYPQEPINPNNTDPDLHDVANSCTDIIQNQGNAPGPDSTPKLDKSRIDYIWASWEHPSGAVEPGLQQALTRVAYASADLGVDPNPDQNLENYSDHRAVQALLIWPTYTG